MPPHHALAEALRGSIDAAGIADDRRSPVPYGSGDKGNVLSTSRWASLTRGALFGVRDRGRHRRGDRVLMTFRATVIIAYLANGGALVHARNGGACRAAHHEAL